MTSLDPRTMAAILGVSHVLQVVVLSVQYAVNRAYRGVGWWLLWSSCIAAGSVFMLLRDVPSLRVAAILAQNSVIVVGVVVLYVGLMRFYGRGVRRAGVAVILVGFLVGHAYFLLAVDDIVARSVLVSAALAATSLLTAYDLFDARTRATRGSASFLCAVLLVHALFFVWRTVAILLGIIVAVDFSSGLNSATLFEGFVVGFLLMAGVVILMNQRAYAEMVEARDHFELLYNVSPEAVLISGLDDGICRSVNPGFEALSGYGREEILGRTVESLGLYEDPADRERVKEALMARGAADSLAIPFRRKDGSPFFGSLSARIFPLQGTRHVMSVTRDVTWQKKDEEELQRRAREIQELNAGLERRVAERTAELREANQEMEALVHSIAHDLRAPLRTVDGFSALLEREHAGSLDGEGAGLLARIRAGAQRADRLIRDLIAYAGIGTANLRPARVEMSAAARTVFDEVADEEVRRTFRFTVGDLPPATGDPGMLRTLFRILLSNAVKFSLPSADRRVEVSGRRLAGEVEYRVEDAGIGFDPAYAANLFGVFQRLEAGTGFEGTGIGLATAKRIAERHGGRIRAEGTVNGGAAFTFTLPDAGGERA